MRLGDLDALHDFVMEEMRRNPHNGHVERMMHRHEHESFLRDIRFAPTIDAAPVVHGQWIEKQDLYDKGFYISRKFWWECSCCGLKTDWKDESFQTQVGYNYCPNCGARMDGDG